LIWLPGLVAGITVHEAAHAISARWLGDDTAERMGRISLNPLRHLSLLGTLALFAVGFGWGKPVPINVNNFKRPRLDYLLSSLAGPASNLALCALSLAILYLKPPQAVALIFTSLFFVNAILAMVNLLPIPPLDGSKIWPCLIPQLEPIMAGQWSTLWMVLLVIFFFTGAIDLVLAPVIRFLISLLP